jgi:hypothetical protein
MITPFQKKLLAGLIIMALLSPVGILLPKMLSSEDAWGEWGTDKIEKLLGYVPEGMKKIAEIWKSPIRDYNFSGGNSPISTQILSYIGSGFLGIIVIGGMIYLISRLLVKNGK